MKQFYDVVRAKLFGGKLTQSQVDGIALLLSAMSPFSLYEQAYMLATVYHETAHTMQPIEEYGKGRRYIYGRWRTNSRGVRFCYTDGTRKRVYTSVEFPHLYYGRGYVQLTWLSNYLRAGRELGAMLDYPNQLADKPDLALRPDVAAAVLTLGMQHGWFTGKRLADYVNAYKQDYRNARRVINGTDKADLIAGYAVIFQQALEAIDV